MSSSPSRRRRPHSSLAARSPFRPPPPLAYAVVVVVTIVVVAYAESSSAADPSSHRHRSDARYGGGEYDPTTSTNGHDDAAAIPDDDARDESSSSSSSSSNDHPPLFPLHATDIYGFLCASLGLIVAAGGGIGGGGILVPVYMLVLGFDPRRAIPLSNVTVLGGAIANTLYNANRRHPRADRPLIDWDLLCIMEPSTLAGALIGSNLNKVLPQDVVLVSLVTLLAFTAYGTLNKAWEMHATETEGRRRRRMRCGDGGGGGSRRTIGGCNDDDDDDDDGCDAPLLSGSTPSFDVEGEEYDDDERRDVAAEEEEEEEQEEEEEDGGDEVELLRVYGRGMGRQSSSRYVPPDHRPPAVPWRYVVDDDPDDERRRRQQRGHNREQRCGDDAEDDYDDSGDEDLPEYSDPIALEIILIEERRPRRRNVLLIVCMFLVVLSINILKGGGGFHSPLGIACGSASFWMAQFSLLVWIAFVLWVGRGYLLADARRKADAGYVYLDDDLRWDGKSTVIYPLVSALAGIFAGMFGIGGGIIKGPLMLAMGIHPAVASATSACMILFTSFTATTTFCVYGLMVPDYAIAGGILGFVATYVGQSVMSRMLAKSRRNSYIAFSIGLVVLLSAVLMAVESAIRLASSAEDGAGDRSSGGICDTNHLNANNS